MPDVDSYPAGVPCWVETLQPDLAAATRFYAGVFGWTMVADDDVSPTYAVATLRGREVAGIASATALGVDDAAAWHTQIRVDDLDEALSRAVEAGCDGRRRSGRRQPGRPVGGPHRSGRGANRPLGGGRP